MTEAKDLVHRLFDNNLVIPNNVKKSIELWHYTNRGYFHNKRLEERRKMCPSLFIFGHNAINNIDYTYLNLSDNRLLDQHPDVNFESGEDIALFCATPTFFLVEDPSLLQGEDLVCDDYNECDIVFMLICPGDPLGDYQLYSVGELLSCFEINQDLLDPYSRPLTRFSEAQISRLRKLSEENSLAHGLLDLIEEIGDGIRRRLEYIQEIRIRVDIDEPLIREFLGNLLDAAMRMRGWTGEGPYPLRAPDTAGDVDEVGVLEIVYELYMNDKYADLRKLPIFGYNIMDKIFEMSTNNIIGLTIHDKLHTILLNRDSNACIRLSSNYLAWTCWYYLNRFYGEEPFEIEILRFIS